MQLRKYCKEGILLRKIVFSSLLRVFAVLLISRTQKTHSFSLFSSKGALSLSPSLPMHSNPSCPLSLPFSLPPPPTTPPKGVRVEGRLACLSFFMCFASPRKVKAVFRISCACLCRVRGSCGKTLCVSAPFFFLLLLLLPPQ